jgi:DnaK suppressor protein
MVQAPWCLRARAMANPCQRIDVVNKKDVKRFKDLLLEERANIIKKASKTLSEEATLDVSELPDEIDQASAEYNQSFIFRLRDREKYYLSKVDKALKKIEEGEFGVCESCGEDISIKRLEARPVTTLCIRCKEEQEMEERSYA